MHSYLSSPLPHTPDAAASFFYIICIVYRVTFFKIITITIIFPWLSQRIVAIAFPAAERLCCMYRLLDSNCYQMIHISLIAWYIYNDQLLYAHNESGALCCNSYLSLPFTALSRRGRLSLSMYTVYYANPLNRERSGSVVECLTRDRRAAGSSLTGVTALWSLSKTHLS